VPVRQGDRVCLRVGNLTMTNHPLHLHGDEFEVTGTDGGWTPPGSRWPEVTTDVAVGQMRAIEFIATEPGDWAFHCHKSHHTMNAMGHSVPTLIGVDHRSIAEKINKIVPDYMVMGDKGGSMGGMFIVLKVRKDQKPGNYSDPGWYKHPAGTVAYEWTGQLPEPARSSDAGRSLMPATSKPDVKLQMRKPVGHSEH
jgi:hypothetical protein